MRARPALRPVTIKAVHEGSCDLSSSPPRCKYEPIQGLVDDGLDAEIQADTIHRATLISAGDAFYFTVFETTNARNELTLYRVRNASDEYEKLTSFSAFSPACSRRAAQHGLVADTSNTSVGLVLHGFFALDDNVYHIRARRQFRPANAPLTTLATNIRLAQSAALPRRRTCRGSIVGHGSTRTAPSPPRAPKAIGALGSTATPRRSSR